MFWIIIKTTIKAIFIINQHQIRPTINHCRVSSKFLWAPSRVMWHRYTDLAQNDTIYVIKALKRTNTKATSHKTLCRQVKGANWVSSRIRAPMKETELFFEMFVHLIHMTLLSAQDFVVFAVRYEPYRAVRRITCTE